MKKFLDVVPKTVKVCAGIAMGALPLVGAVVGGCLAWSGVGGRWPWIAFAGLGLGLFAGAFLAAWVLCLGYVYADAARREMRPVLWTLIAALFPNLFGFLLYFALRQPLGPKCGGCGQPMGLEQRFCSWCGRGRPVVTGAQYETSERGPTATA